MYLCDTKYSGRCVLSRCRNGVLNLPRANLRLLSLVLTWTGPSRCTEARWSSRRINWITQELYCLISNNFIILLRLASPVWVGRAILHTKTLLDVYLLSSNVANLVLKEDTATGTSISVMTIQSLRFWRRVYCISSLTWASYVAYPLSRQRRPDDGMSRS